MKNAVETADAPKAVGPYSQAINQNGWLYCSGQIPLDPNSGQLIEGDIVAQTHQVMKNLEAVLKAAGYDFSSVVKSTIYLQDLKNFSKVNEVYAGYLSQPFPARAAFEVAGLPLGADVEIEMIAYRG
jgi:2-iminobutanoate/2-iminopropanoate deaminase